MGIHIARGKSLFVCNFARYRYSFQFIFSIQISWNALNLPESAPNPDMLTIADCTKLLQLSNNQRKQFYRYLHKNQHQKNEKKVKWKQLLFWTRRGALSFKNHHKLSLITHFKTDFFLLLGNCTFTTTR